MKQILYIKHADSSFVLSDQRILEKQYRVIPFLINQNKGGFYFLKRMVALALFILSHFRGTDAMVTWFGDYHSALMVFLGKLLRIKVIIFAGGQEAVCYPELGKGVYNKKLRGCMVRYALKNAALIIPNHKSLIYHENFFYSDSGKKDGIKFYIPDLKTPVAIVPNGIDTSKFYRDPIVQKIPDLVLTVGTMSSVSDFINKGFDLFIQMARRNPDLKFILIGIKRQFLPWVEEHYHVSEISNLELIFSYVPDEVLLQNYNKAKVFVQASITEGMPNTLNEAMLCECIPVGSDVNGIPDAIGDTGIVVKRRNIDELERAMRIALSKDTGQDTRQHVLNNFSKVIREENLLVVFNQFFTEGSVSRKFNQ